MKILNQIKKIIYSGTFAFTVTVFVFMAMFAIIENDSSVTETRAIPLSNYPWILLFSFITAAFNHLLTAKRIPLAIKLPLHAAGVLGAFYFIILRVFGLGQHGRGRFSVMIIAFIIYAVVLTASYFIRRAVFNLCRKTQMKAPPAADTQENEQ
ncbi:MAG: hypothetical protein IJE84_02905 [Clostridia bacterium]|nr:hypothetical protein [Clostridia bacterium]